jgi:hypothetical protein
VAFPITEPPTSTHPTTIAPTSTQPTPNIVTQTIRAKVQGTQDNPQTTTKHSMANPSLPHHLRGGDTTPEGDSIISSKAKAGKSPNISTTPASNPPITNNNIGEPVPSRDPRRPELYTPAPTISS